MKNLSKWLTIMIVLSCALSSQMNVTAQNVKTLTSDDYSRLSVTFLMGNYAVESAFQEAVKAAEKIPFSDKYNNHNLKGISLPLGQDFKVLSFDKKRVFLKELLEKQGIGRSMVAKWFNRQENGMMNLDYVHQSGLYNATDQDVKMAATAKRGDAFLKDAGQNLVDKSYVLVLVPTDIKSNDDGKTRGWVITYDLFFYKIRFTPDVVARFYNIWPYDDEDALVKKNKIVAFDTLTFKFDDVYSKTLQSASSSETLTNNKSPKSLTQLLEQATKSMYENSTFLLDKSIEDFRVKVKVSKISPIRAKIGKKEGLKCDNQYFVYQYKWNERSGKAEPERQAVVRSTSNIVDNRQIATGKSPESVFYQTYGGNIREGMVLQQRLDFGFSTIVGYESGNIGGTDLNFMIRTGPFTKVTALYLMIDLGFQSGDYTTITFGAKKFSFFRYSLGFGKGMRLGRILELTPYLHYGIEQTSNDDLSRKQISTSFIKGGTMLGISLTHNFSILGQLNYYSPFGTISAKDKDDKKVEGLTTTWTEEFMDRSGMGIMAGIRYEF